MKRIARPLVPFIILVTVAIAILSSRPPVRAYEPKPVKRYLHAAYPFANEAKLILANSTMHDVTIKGRVYSPAGRAAVLQDVLLDAHQQTIVDLGLQLSHLGREFQNGGLELEFESADPGIAGQLALRNSADRLAIDVPLRSSAYSRSSRLEGFWLLPARDATLGLIVYNRSDVAMTGTMTVSREDGLVVGSVPLRLAPRQSQTFDLRSLPRGLFGQMGGVSLQHDGKPGALVATGYLDMPLRRHTIGLPFVDPAMLTGASLYGGGVQLGQTPLANESFSGQLLVRNLTAQDLPVTPSLQCADQRTPLAGFSLRVGESKRIDVPADAIACEGPVGIEVRTSAVGSLMGRWLSVTERSGLLVETALHSFPPTANLSGSNPWWIDGETASILYVQNTGDQDATFVPVIHYYRHGGHSGYGGHSDERYVVGLTRVRPGETVAIDIRVLRDSQTPDVEGRVLPPDITSGQIHWLRRSGPALVANVLTVNATRRAASTFNFLCCFCSPRDVWLELRPGPNVNAQVGDFVQEGMWEHLVDCHYQETVFPVPASQVDWGSTNPLVASVNSSGRVACGPFAGTAQIVGSKWVIWYELPEYPDYCQVDDPTCYPSYPPTCLSDEAYRYAWTNFDVSAPPPPPPPPTVTTDDVVVIAWVDSSVIGLPGGANQQLIDELNSVGLCSLLVAEWAVGIPKLLTNDADKAYANAFLVKFSGNDLPPLGNPGSVLASGDFRLYSRFQVRFTPSGNQITSPVVLQSNSTIGSTPDPCGILPPVSGEAHPANGAQGLTPSGTSIYRLTEGRLGSVGQSVYLTINGRTTPFIWNVIRFNASGTLTASDRAIFPTYYVYRNGQLVGGFDQSAVSTFVALDGFYQRQPGEIQ